MADETVVEETQDEVQEVGVRDLLDAGLHFGHQTKRWNPKMKPFIFDKRNGIHISNGGLDSLRWHKEAGAEGCHRYSGRG